MAGAAITAAAAVGAGARAIAAAMGEAAGGKGAERQGWEDGECEEARAGAGGASRGLDTRRR